jgi:predicted component of type VI protein secretion system
MPASPSDEAPSTGDLALALMSQEVRGLRGALVVVAEGKDFGLELSLRGDASAMTVGRAKDCALVLTDPSVRPKHATILRRDESFVVRAHDTTLLGSTSMLPGDEVEWNPRHMLRIGETVLALELPAERAKVLLSDPVITAAINATPKTVAINNEAPAPPSETVPESEDPSPTGPTQAPTEAAPMASIPVLEQKATAQRRFKSDQLVMIGVAVVLLLAVGLLVVLLLGG